MKKWICFDENSRLEAKVNLASVLKAITAQIILFHEF